MGDLVEYFARSSFLGAILVTEEGGRREGMEAQVSNLPPLPDFQQGNPPMPAIRRKWAGVWVLRSVFKHSKRQMLGKI